MLTSVTYLVFLVGATALAGVIYLGLIKTQLI